MCWVKKTTLTIDKHGIDHYYHYMKQNNNNLDSIGDDSSPQLYLRIDTYIHVHFYNNNPNLNLHTTKQYY